MRGERLLSGYLVRVAVRRNRWRITLHDLRTGEVESFASFEALAARLERAAARLVDPSPAPPERRR